MPSSRAAGQGKGGLMFTDQRHRKMRRGKCAIPRRGKTSRDDRKAGAAQREPRAGREHGFSRRYTRLKWLQRRGSPVSGARGAAPRDVIRPSRRRMRAQGRSRRVGTSDGIDGETLSCAAHWVYCGRARASTGAENAVVAREDMCALSTADSGPKRRTAARGRAGAAPEFRQARPDINASAYSSSTHND